MNLRFELHDLRVFCAAAPRDSVAATAARLGCAPANLGRRGAAPPAVDVKMRPGCRDAGARLEPPARALLTRVGAHGPMPQRPAGGRSGARGRVRAWPSGIGSIAIHESAEDPMFQSPVIAQVSSP